MINDCTLFMPVLLPLAGAAVTLAGKSFNQKRVHIIFEYIGAVLSLVIPLALLISVFPAVYGGSSYTTVIGSWDSSIGIEWTFDGLAWLMQLLVFFISLCSWLYSRNEGPKSTLSSVLFFLLAASGAAAAVTRDIFNLFVCLELAGAVSYVLITTSGKPGSVSSSLTYLLTSSAAMLLFLLGIFGLYRLTGSLSYTGIAEGLLQLEGNGGIAAVSSISLIMTAVLLRCASFPLHGWLPSAHSLAPHAVSAVLSGVLIKIPLLALTRFLPIMPFSSAVGTAVSAAGAASAAFGVLSAIAQSDAKRLLAYHSVSQIGKIHVYS